VKLLLDQGLPGTTAEALGRLGFEAVHTGAIGMAKATDEDILDRARREGETVVTLDADFHTLLAIANGAAPSVIRVRVGGLRGVGSGRPHLAAPQVVRSDELGGRPIGRGKRPERTASRDARCDQADHEQRAENENPPATHEATYHALATRSPTPTQVTTNLARSSPGTKRNANVGGNSGGGPSR